MSKQKAKTETTEPYVFVDVRCPKCGKRYGWHGKLGVLAPCPRCSNSPSPKLGKKIKSSLRQGHAFGLVQTLYYERAENMSPTERSFIVNMYRRFRSNKEYNETQIVSICRIASKYSAHWENKDEVAAPTN